MSSVANEVFDIEYDSNINDAEPETTKKFLAFQSDELYYAIDSDYVNEIIMNDAITRLPKLPSYVKGIINLRGQIVPILDIRLRMGRMPGEFTSETCIIVMEVDGVPLGILVDRVSQIIDLAETDISAQPVSKHQDLVQGIARVNGVVHLVINCEGLMRK